MDSPLLFPRVLRPVADPLALYLRIGRNDHGHLLDLIARGDAQCFGLVIEATAVKRQRELRQQAQAARLDIILDPRTQASATAGGHSDELAALPWGLSRPHRLEDFEGGAGQQRLAAMAQLTVSEGFTQVLAPTHLVTSSVDPWLTLDVESTRVLRHELDRSGGQQVQILYSLAIPYALLRDDSERGALIAMLIDAPADAYWLRIEGLGSDATATGVRNYAIGAQAFRALGKPVIADGIGGLAGLSLLALGAAGGLAHGITFGERVDHANWRRPRLGTPFGRSRRVYLPDLDLLLEPDVADATLHSSPRAAALLSCRDTRCCPRAIKDMVENPVRHYLIQRMRQVAALGRIPVSLRPQHFIEHMVRPASDTLMQASNWKLKDEEVSKLIKKQRTRVDALRSALPALAERLERQRPALPRTRSAREPRPSL